jgi:hypothetical protein
MFMWYIAIYGQIDDGDSRRWKASKRAGEGESPAGYRRPKITPKCGIKTQGVDAAGKGRYRFKRI